MSGEAMLILAAGLGTRLRPATLNCPKPLIPVAGLDPLFFAVFKAYRIGVRDFYVNVHYLPALIHEALKEFSVIFPDARFTVLDETAEVLGSGGALLNLFALHGADLRGKALWAVNGDTLAEFDWTRLRKSAGSAFAVSLREDHLRRYNPLWCEVSGAYRGVGKALENQGLTPTHFVGVRRYAAADITYLIDRNLPVRNVDLFRGIYEELGRAGRMPVMHEGYARGERDSERSFCFDMTNEEFLLEAQAHIFAVMDRYTAWREALALRYPGVREARPGAWVAGEVPPQTELRAPCVAVFGIPVPGARAVAIGPNAGVVLRRAVDLAGWAVDHGVVGSIRDASAIFLKRPGTPLPAAEGESPRRVWAE